MHIYLLEGKGLCSKIYVFLGAYIFKLGSACFIPASHKLGHTRLWGYTAFGGRGKET